MEHNRDFKEKLLVENTESYFLVAETIKKIDGSDDPDLMKIRLLVSEASRIFKEFNILGSDVRKVRALSYNPDKNVWRFKDLTEDEIIKQIEKAKEMFKNDVMIDNISSLAVFYKKMYIKSQRYEPFFQYCIELADRIISSEKVAGNLKMKDKISDMDKILKLKEAEIDQLKNSLEISQHNLSKLKEMISESLVDQNLLGMYSEIYRKNITNPAVIQMIVYINSNGGSISKQELTKSIGLRTSNIDDVLNTYPEIFSYDGKTVKLIYFDKDKLAEVNEAVQKEVEMVDLEQPIKKDSFFEKIKNVFFKKVQKEEQDGKN